MFKALGATHIVRLNYPEYDPTPFIEVRRRTMVGWIQSESESRVTPNTEAKPNKNPWVSHPFEYPRYFERYLVNAVCAQTPPLSHPDSHPVSHPYTRAQAGLHHVDLYFPDGCSPSLGVAAHFIELIERAPGTALP